MRRILVLIYILVPVALFSVLIWFYPHGSNTKFDPAIESCKGKPAASPLPPETELTLPLQTEKQKPHPAIARLFKNCAKRIESEGIDAVIPYLDSALAVIETQHGRNSVAYADTLSQIIVLIDRNASGRFDLIKPYSQAAVSVSREIYGMDHRETALSLHTHADVLIGLNKDGWTDEAITLLREATEIRHRVLGADHAVTTSAEGTLARMLFLKWRQSDGENLESELFEEAERLAKNTHAWCRKQSDKPDANTGWEKLLGRIAYARGDYESAADYFDIAFSSKSDSPFAAIGRAVGCAVEAIVCEEYADALRKLGRNEEAAAIEQRLGKSTPKP